MQLIESKSILAKLMATENLVVEQRNVQTASFDVKNRILTLPILDKNISSELYDLFTGHEVGHALYTPMDGMLKAKENKMNMDVLNVVEDSRIERKIKYKYPGLKSSFVKAYNDLSERDFFGIKDKNVNKMNFLDRINLHCKVGAHLRIEFSDFEKELLKEVENTETYDDVIDVSKKITQYMKEKIQEQKEQKQKYQKVRGSKEESGEKSEESDEESQEFDEYEESDEINSDEINSDDGEVDTEPQNSGEESESDDKTSKSSERNEEKEEKESEDTENLDDEIRSHTDESFKRNEKQLYDNSGTRVMYVNVPKLDVEHINDYKDIWTKHKYEKWEIAPQQFLKIRKESNKVVSYLIKEFELRKNAHQLKRASTAKTGDLDLNKIFSYNFNEDIFKKITVTPGGKSHGLVMFLDWSGSMIDHIGNTVKQLINLVLFCKKQNIPYEVYAFLEDTSYEMKKSRQIKKPNDLQAKDYALMNLLSSRMNSDYFTYACSALVQMSGLGTRSRCSFPTWLAMHGTPLNQAIIHAMEIVPHFQKKNGLQIVNTIFLTDGEGSLLNRYYDPTYFTNSDYDASCHIKCDRLIIRDPVTKYEQVIDSKNSRYTAQTDALIRLLKKRTNSNVIGFYVIKGRDFNNKVYDWYPNQRNHQEIKDEFRKNQFAILENTGYDEYYILRSSSLDTDEDASFEVRDNATMRGIASAFTKYNTGKHNSRVVLNRFIGLIA